jgi:[FeFe] hydrogenase H-cluster maturation GTPase HydF
MEILPLGPVYLVDTAGLDDSGELGEKRIEKTLSTLKSTDLILLTTTYELFDRLEEDFIKSNRDKKIILIINKVDSSSPTRRFELQKSIQTLEIPYIEVSAKTGTNINKLKELITLTLSNTPSNNNIISDLIDAGDLVIQVMPIDLAAPKGRIILPQQQVLREALDNHTLSICIQPEELKAVLNSLVNKPKLIITDSQVIKFVGDHTPYDIPITTYSILFSRLKGDLHLLIDGLKALSTLEDGDQVMIAEACTHHSQADDIGRVKIPRWLNQYTNKELEFIINSGKTLTNDFSNVKLIVHCGGCMINRCELLSRQDTALRANIPMTNYGVLISHLHNYLHRALVPLPIYHRQYCSIFPDLCQIET